MGFVPGQFASVADAQLPGSNRYPFYNRQPFGDYVLELLEMRGFEGRDGVAAFAADFRVVSGPEGHDDKVCFLVKRGSFYYDRDIKMLATALTGAEENVTETYMEMMCGDDNPAAGCYVNSEVYNKPKKTSSGVPVKDADGNQLFQSVCTFSNRPS